MALSHTAAVQLWDLAAGKGEQRRSRVTLSAEERLPTSAALLYSSTSTQSCSLSFVVLCALDIFYALHRNELPLGSATV